MRCLGCVRFAVSETPHVEVHLSVRSPTALPSSPMRLCMPDGRRKENQELNFLLLHCFGRHAQAGRQKKASKTSCLSAICLSQMHRGGRGFSSGVHVVYSHSAGSQLHLFSGTKNPCQTDGITRHRANASLDRFRGPCPPLQCRSHPAHTTSNERPIIASRAGEEGLNTRSPTKLRAR